MKCVFIRPIISRLSSSFAQRLVSKGEHVVKHNGVESCIIPFLFSAHILTSANINAPFCACLSAWNGQSNHSLLFPLCIWRNVPLSGLSQEEEILLKLSPVFQLFISPLHFRGSYYGTCCSWDFLFCFSMLP